MDASLVNNGGARIPDGATNGSVDSFGRTDRIQSIFRDLNHIARALDAPFEEARGLIESAILKHTSAETAGASLFGAEGYHPSRDCPNLAGRPSLEAPFQRALEGGVPLASDRILLAPIMVGESPVGMIWAARPLGEWSIGGRETEFIGFLAQFIAAKRPVPAIPGAADVYNKVAGFRALIQNIKDYAIFTVDPRGIVTDWTEGARQVLGYSPSEVIGKDFRMFFTDEDVRAGEPQMELAQAAAEGRAERESWRVHRNGGKIWVNAISSSIRDEHGALVGFIKVSRDLTERRRIEVERAEDAMQLRSARQLADKANQAKSRFLATASHDLRQPLQSLSLLSGTLRRMATNPHLLDAVEQQGLAIASMSGLLNALLDISKLDSGAVQPSLQHVDLDDIFAQMRIEFSGLAAKKALALQVSRCAQFVYTDPTLFGQILRNLLSNALRYTKRGSVTLASTLENGEVKITVSDTGIGIAETHLERIFEEFYQVDVSPNSVREGHGLGLSIVQRTAAILGHALRVDSRPGSGSTFTITVPAGRAAPKQEVMHDPPMPVVCGEAPHVLLIEDDPGVLKATRLLLEVEGYRVTVGRTLADARAATGAHPDIQLLISDYHLADGESGREAIEIVRQALPRIEVILMTGDTAGLQHMSLSDRICVASKPIDADGLLGMMKRLLMPVCRVRSAKLERGDAGGATIARDRRRP